MIRAVRAVVSSGGAVSDGVEKRGGGRGCRSNFNLGVVEGGGLESKACRGFPIVHYKEGKMWEICLKLFNVFCKSVPSLAEFLSRSSLRKTFQNGHKYFVVVKLFDWLQVYVLFRLNKIRASMFSSRSIWMVAIAAHCCRFPSVLRFLYTFQNFIIFLYIKLIRYCIYDFAHTKFVILNV